jgi:repressor LexA
VRPRDVGKTLRAVDELWHERGYAPTYREIRERIDVASTNTVQKHLLCLKRDGLVEYRPDAARTVRLTDKGRALIERVS